MALVDNAFSFALGSQVTNYLPRLLQVWAEGAGALITRHMESHSIIVNEPLDINDAVRKGIGGVPSLAKLTFDFAKKERINLDDMLVSGTFHAFCVEIFANFQQWVAQNFQKYFPKRSSDRSSS